jgi:hypothetical protein
VGLLGRPMTAATLQRVNSPLLGTMGMIVEDSQYGMSLSSLLRRWTHKPVQVRANADLAREVLATGKMQWAIIDNGLTGSETGADLARWLRDHCPTVIRIAHSGRDASWHQQLLADDAAFCPGVSPLFHASVPKPTDAAELVATLATLLQNERNP